MSMTKQMRELAESFGLVGTIDGDPAINTPVQTPKNVDWSFADTIDFAELYKPPINQMNEV